MNRVRIRAAVVLLLLGLAAVAFSCSSGPKISQDPAAQEFYKTARLVMTSEEKDIFSHLPAAAARQEFINDFWAKRDPNPDTEENEFRSEFEARIDYANRRFKEGGLGMNTDRGRIFIYLGPPEKTEEFINHGYEEVKGIVLWWVYYTYELGIEFADVRGDGTYSILNISGDLMGAMEQAKLGQISSAAGSGLKFVNFKAQYDKIKKEVVVTIPTSALSFKEGRGTVKLGFEFEFFLYDQTGQKRTFEESRTFEASEEDALKLKAVTFAFPLELWSGKNYLDIIIVIPELSSKTRKIFDFKQ